jgi:hypothetical protein
VAVNSIVGLPFILSAKLTLDMNDEVITSAVLDMDPIPVTYKRTINSLPDFSTLEQDGTKSLLAAQDRNMSVSSAPMEYTPETRHPTSNLTVHLKPTVTVEIIDQCWADCHATDIDDNTKEDDKTVNTGNLHDHDHLASGVIPSFPASAMNSTFFNE